MEVRPKVLIVTRGAWDDNKGTSSTLSNLFSDYGADRIASIYIEARGPKTRCCNLFFQIPEITMLKKLVNWKVKIGTRIDMRMGFELNLTDAKQEEDALRYVRGHRSILFSWLRELLWGLNLWKTSGLKSFVKEFNPDVVWLDGSTNIFLDRLYLYVLRITKKPCLIYLMDDNYTYKSMAGFHPLYYTLHRITMRKVVKQCKVVLTISPKMKREFDSIFKVDSTIVTKGIDYSNIDYSRTVVHTPIRLLYMGQIIYGRDYTLSSVIKALDEINANGPRIVLNVYTKNLIPKHLKKVVAESKSVDLKEAVPYSKVPQVISENDVLLFMESLDPRYNRDARLSFSTKITDYMASNRCIFAVGPEDCAPLEYFRDNNCAIIAQDQEQIKDGLQKLLSVETINNYSFNAYNVGRANHDKRIILTRLYNVIKEIAE